MTQRLDAEASDGPLVSVIIPVYNAGKFLERSIISIQSQSHQNIELLLINDGSTDDSATICEYFAARDTRIRVISQKNSGPAAARNNGLRYATGEYVFFLDADDYILPHTICTLLTAYIDYDPDLVICNFSKQANDNEIIRQQISFTPDNNLFEGHVKNMCAADMVLFVRHFLKHPSNHLISYCWARLYRTELVRAHNISSHEEMRLFEDFVLNLDYISHAEKVIFVNEPLYVYVMHSNHVSASMAIINSQSLLHDMTIFKEKAGEYLRSKSAGSMSEKDINREIGHTLIHYLIIFIVRSCLQINGQTQDRIYAEIDTMINASLIRESLKHYSPSPGNSRILPFLMRLGMTGLIMQICRYKARKRYGRS